MIYKNLIRSLLFSMDAEDAHHFVISLLDKYSAFARLFQHGFVVNDERLHVTIHGMDFLNPVGMAAGFDKSADVLHVLPSFGFGFIEIGTVTPLAQIGNPKPRIFRLPEDFALINRLGFNNRGVIAVWRKLKRLVSENKFPKIPVGINMGKGKDTPLDDATSDYLNVFERLYPFGSYFVVNVSSPNTPNLRELQNRAFLTELVLALQAKNEDAKPLFVKIAPDLTYPQIDAIIEIVIEHNVSGIIATNTTISRDELRRDIQQQGGLSGKPLRKKASEIIGYIYRNTGGRVPIIGVGGIFSAEDAYEKLTLGASLVQVYTGFVYEGASFIKDINLGLLRFMETDGIKNIQDVVGMRNT